jgi:protein-serine/threonine kinase
MPQVAANAPHLAISTLSDRLHHRDSRLVDFHLSIEEEDESTGTASEPAEPLTPTSHTSETMPFRHDEHVDDVFAAQKPAMVDVPTKPLPQDTVRPTPLSTRSRQNTPPQAEQSSPEKLGLGKRVGSFMRSKLHRSKDGASQAEQSNSVVADRSPRAAPAARTTNIVKTGVDGPASVATPAVDIPKQSRRLSTFSLTRRSDRSARASSPPTSGSPTSMLDVADRRPGLGTKPASSTALSSMDRPRPGITWAGSGSVKTVRKQGWTRRRSASQEQVPRMVKDEEKPTAGMLTTFSKPLVRSGQGVQKLEFDAWQEREASRQGCYFRGAHHGTKECHVKRRRTRGRERV